MSFSKMSVNFSTRPFWRFVINNQVGNGMDSQDPSANSLIEQISDIEDEEYDNRFLIIWILSPTIVNQISP